VGALEFIDGYLLGLWFVFLGIFLVQAARTEEGYALTHSALGDARVREIMSADPVSFSSSMTVAELLEDQLHLHHFNTFPLLTPRGDLCGLTTLGRIRRVPPDQRTRTHLVDVACALDSVPTASPDARVTDLLTRMQGSPDGRGLVLENGRLVGVVSPSDIARYVQLSLLRHGVPSR
jgi:CBS-domain-containing membrane protein